MDVPEGMSDPRPTFTSTAPLGSISKKKQSPYQFHLKHVERKTRTELFLVEKVLRRQGVW